MNQRRCHRCSSELHAETEGALFYCWHCGAPQVTLSEELREQAENLWRAQANETGGAADTTSVQASQTISWKAAISLSAAVAGALSLLSFALPFMTLLVWMWAPLAPSIVMWIYTARNRDARLSRKIGMRVGLICGLLIVTGLALVNAIELDVVRFGMHHMEDFDASINSALAQMKTQVIAQSGQQAADMFNILNIPEFRAGFFLAGFGMLSAFVLLLSTAGGALAGFIQSRKPAA